MRRKDDDEVRIRSLAALARVLSRPDTLHRLLELSAEEALRTLRAASVSISRLQPDGESVRTIVNVGDLGPHEERWPENEVHPMQELRGLDVTSDRLVTWSWHLDSPATPPAEKALLRALGKGSSVSTPLVVEGELWGEVYATRHRFDDPFDEDDIAYLEAMIAIMAGALARASREETLTQLAYHDPLTGLLNRRAIDDHAKIAFDVPPGMIRQVGVVALDINGLKLTNDPHGHAAGDELIRRVAGDLVRSFAVLSACVVGRVGGDEFTVLSVGRSMEPLVEVANQVVARSWERDPTTALSGGVAHADLSDELRLTPSEMFAAADRALYVAKRERRRQVVLAEPLEPAGPPAE